jgi:hypothetical protein
MRIPAAGGAPEKVMEMQPTASFRVARNGNHLCVIQELRRVGHAVFTSFDPIRGRGRELANVEIATDQPPTWDLAPDGSAMAVLVPSDSLARIDVLSLPAGKRETVQVRSAFGIASLAWTADGKGWIAVGANQDEGWRLLRIGRDGSVSLLTPQQMWMYSAEDSPDGRFVAFTSNTGQGNVWMLENF